MTNTMKERYTTLTTATLVGFFFFSLAGVGPEERKTIEVAAVESLKFFISLNYFITFRWMVWGFIFLLLHHFVIPLICTHARAHTQSKRNVWCNDNGAVKRENAKTFFFFFKKKEEEKMKMIIFH